MNLQVLMQLVRLEGFTVTLQPIKYSKIADISLVLSKDSQCMSITLTHELLDNLDPKIFAITMEETINNFRKKLGTYELHNSNRG